MSTKKVTEIPTIDVVMVVVEPEEGDSYVLDTASKIAVEPQTETQDAIKLIVKGKLKAQKLEQVTITGNQITLTDNVFTPELVKILQGGTIIYGTNYTYTVGAGGLATGTYYFLTSDGYVVFTLTSALSEGDVITYRDTGALTITTGGVTTPHAFTVSAAVPGSGTSLEVTSSAGTNIRSYTPPTVGSGEKGVPFQLHAYSAQYDTSGQIVQYERIDYPNCQGIPIALSSEDNVFRVSEYTINSAPKSNEAPYSIHYIDALPVIS